MVMSNFSSTIPDPSQDGAKWLRIFWALLTALLTISMLVAGGVTTMEYATLIFALPVTVIAYLVMASFSKVLRMERAEREGRSRRHRGSAAHGGRAPEKTWRQRLAGMRSYPSERSAERFLEEIVRPALDAVATEFRTQGSQIDLSRSTNEETGLTDTLLRVDMGEHRSFLYQVTAVAYRIPEFGARNAARGDDVYFQIEVFTHTGSEGYDLMGLTAQQIIDDVLDRYETHLSFLEYSHEHSYQSVLTPPTPPSSGPIPAVPDSAHEVEAVRPSTRTARDDENGRRRTAEAGRRLLLAAAGWRLSGSALGSQASPDGFGTPGEEGLHECERFCPVSQRSAKRRGRRVRLHVLE